MRIVLTANGRTATMALFDRGVVFKEQEVIVKHMLYTDGTINTVSMGELVRCKDCRYWDKYPSSSVAPQYHECKARAGRLGRIHTTEEEYCSRGERKDGDHHDTV